MQTTEIIRLVWAACLWPILLGVACLYAWAGVCFACFRFRRPETAARCKTFLYHRFLASPYPRRFLRGPRRVTRVDAVRFGYNAWNLATLPLILLQAGHLSKWSILLANGSLFFAGLALAISWYARRCLRRLGTDALSKEEALAGMNLGSHRAELPPRRPTFLFWLAYRLASLWQPLRQRGTEMFSEWSGQ